jgi:anti-sigma factor RsiW
MNCQTFTETIVDVARGRDVGAGTAAAVESHIEHCAACRARLIRERRLSEGLRALAASVAEQGADDALEARLLDAFAAQQSTVAVHPVNANYRWLQVAAALVLLAGAVAAWQVSRAPRVATVTSVAPPPAPQQIAKSIETPPAATTVTDQPRPSKPPVRRPRPSRMVRAEGFVPLPSAAGLPDFESGEIVRVDLPVTSLPMYGIDIAPDARSSVVKADFLIGQDRVARAIRLVPSSRSGAGAHVE